MNERQKSSDESRFGQIFFEDLKRARFQRTYSREIKDLYDFYLDQDSRAKLASMGRVRRAFFILGWLFRSLMTKLSPGRRLALLVACIFTVVGRAGLGFQSLGFELNHDLRPWGFVLLLAMVVALQYLAWDWEASTRDKSAGHSNVGPAAELRAEQEARMQRIGTSMNAIVKKHGGK